MKCAVAFFALIAGCSVLVADAPSPLLNDLVRLSRARTSDASVLAYARAHRAELPPEIPDATLRWLRAAGVSERVVRYMSAIDVRLSAGEFPEGVSDAGARASAARSRAYDYGSDDRGEAESDDAGSFDTRGTQDAGRDASAGYDSGYDSGFGYGYGYGYDPYFGYPSLYAPFPSVVIVGRGGALRRSRRDHRESWRDRGAGDRGRPRDRGGRGGWTADPRSGGRAAMAAARGFAPGARGRAGFSPGPRGFAGRGAPAPGRRMAPTGGPRPGAAGRGFARGSAGVPSGGRGRR